MITIGKLRTRRLRMPALSRKTKRGLLLFSVILGIGMTAIYVDIRHPKQTIYKEIASVPTAPVAIVFGAGYNKDGLSPMLEDRVQAGVDLYKAHKVQMLLMTGDNGRLGYSEPDAMRKEAMSYGVPSNAIRCDYAGFRTYDSLYRARDIFGVQQAILVTQSYHLPRALYIARELGLNCVGVAAEREEYPGQDLRDLREFAAIETAWLDIHVFHRHPTYLGKKEPLFTNS